QGGAVTMPTTDDLVAEAKRLADLLGPAPIEWTSDVPTATAELRTELDTWWHVMDEFERGLADFAGWDEAALRSAAGPPIEVDYHQTWHTLLIGAAHKSEDRSVQGGTTLADLL